VQRVVDYLAGQAGIRQFIDLGSGLPTMDSVHEVARTAAPDARVVYVDFDPVVIAHANALLAGDNVVIVKADIRNPGDILGHPQVAELIDFAQPTAVLMIATLHFIATR
jgi:S-adenosyl methyltransferase